MFPKTSYKLASLLSPSLLAASLATTPALAETSATPAPTAPPQSQAAPPAEATSAAPAPAEAPPPPEKGTREYLVKLVTDGAASYDAGRYAEAIAALREAFEIKPSPTIGIVLAHSYRDLGYFGEALDIYGLVAAYPVDETSHAKLVDAVSQAKAESERLKRDVAWLTLIGADGADVMTGGAARHRYRTGEIALLPGVYAVTVEKQGYRTATFDLVVRPGSRVYQEVKLESLTPVAVAPAPAVKGSRRKRRVVEEAPPRSPALKIIGGTSLGLGIAGALGGGGLVIHAVIQDRKADKFCTNDVCSPEARPFSNNADKAADAATVTFAVAGGFGVLGFGLLIYNSVLQSDHEEAWRARKAGPEIKVTPSPTGFLISGKF